MRILLSIFDLMRCNISSRAWAEISCGRRDPHDLLVFREGGASERAKVAGRSCSGKCSSRETFVSVDQQLLESRDICTTRADREITRKRA